MAYSDQVKDILWKRLVDILLITKARDDTKTILEGNRNEKIDNVNINLKSGYKKKT